MNDEDIDIVYLTYYEAVYSQAIAGSDLSEVRRLHAERLPINHRFMGTEQTGLHKAAASGTDALFYYFLLHPDIDLSITDVNGRDAASYAEIMGRWERGEEIRQQARQGQQLKFCPKP
ncbi:hypothetical protein [Mesorhizobium sp. J428]|uniref:hypothetical protein n=1 Tax=Mesorhizobium sp. J428 TaxID=2898440 RepID=UPI002151646E|nr:hypothetical protein [Mesorhizobium sp. J428]MCR5858272.1 hypothetical protein [Mesorhizobium sp. J428]